MVDAFTGRRDAKVDPRVMDDAHVARENRDLIADRIGKAWVELARLKAGPIGPKHNGTHD